MGFFTSSIGRKIVMSLTGLFLITFLIVHLGVNLLTLVSAELFNEASHFMATNPLIQAMQYVLALGFVLHISQGIILQIRNKQARPQNYAMNKPATNSSWSSRSMILTGLLILLFLILHLKDYFWVMKFGEMPAGQTDYDLVTGLFQNKLYTLIYVASFILLGFHLDHGFQSAFQSAGVNHRKYTPMIRKIGRVYSLLMALGFSLIALYFSFAN
ncbi:MAG: succinate dehydrogenase cytochrome b subunit [Flavobacteriales bacterium]|nr:succinate dehydrogenase cytochrome b subunit [Flavobacteriales bacterium]